MMLLLARIHTDGGVRVQGIWSLVLRLPLNVQVEDTKTVEFTLLNGFVVLCFQWEDHWRSSFNHLLFSPQPKPSFSIETFHYNWNWSTYFISLFFASLFELPIKFIRIFEVLNLFLFIKKFRFKIVLPLVVPRRTAATLHSVSFFIRLPRVRIRDVTLFNYVWIDSEKRKNTTRARCTQTYIHSQRRSSIM